MKQDQQADSIENSGVASPEVNERREALKKLGKYAAYVAPFTVYALSAKGATASGPGPQARRASGR